MQRIVLDFSLTRAAGARQRLRKQIPDLRTEEFAAWDAAGLLEIASSTAASSTSIARLPISSA